VQTFTPAKLIWAESDFEQMSWHDCRLHGIGLFDDFEPHLHQLRLDIDYIFEWVGFGTPAEQPGHWISPATLAFEPQRFHIDLPGPGGDWIIGVERTGTEAARKWIISLNTGGDITVIAPGFTQYIRRAPAFVATPNQYLETTQRGGLSFETSTEQT
jgi:hypothetical protein